MSSFSIGAPNKDNVAVIMIDGPLDEKLAQVVIPHPKSIHLVFNLQKLGTINSAGIRAWIHLMTTLSRHSISFVNCPKSFIDQLNMVGGFITKNSRIVSFYVPYYNEEEAVEKMVLFTYGKEFDDKSVYLPKDIKTDFGGPMEIDVIEQKYFKFIYVPNN